MTGCLWPLRPSTCNKGNIFSCNLSRNNVALQVEMVCCAYYHLLAQQIFILQKVKATSTFCNKNLLCKKVVIRATNHLNLQPNIVARQVARKMLPVLLGLYGYRYTTWNRGEMPTSPPVRRKRQNQLASTMYHARWPRKTTNILCFLLCRTQLLPLIIIIVIINKNNYYHYYYYNCYYYYQVIFQQG